ncbi:Spy/CpxP family protein refolding chaperone [Salinarimonas sp. NSM]|uniref:Spy/CpxP family protein refolding chaperone n=1 Tax=Salinarimonas sp. NSM TaxID=3458003 RepID=UPI004036C841
MTTTPNETKTPTGSRFSRGLLAATVAVLGVGAIGAGFAVAQDAPMLRRAAGDGPRAEMMQARFGEDRGRMAEFMEWRLERTLEGVDASPEQVERIKAIAEEARAEIAPLMRGFRDTREDLAEILGAGTIDRAAAETLRAERLAAMDTASARGLEALLDAAEVLEPEQRAELIEEMGERRRGWGRW